MNGRPLALGDVDAASPAILESWFGGIQSGNAIADVLFGKVNPGGKLPVTFPRTVGQVPIYYNHEPTGRPCDTTQKYNSRYLELPCTPQYAFGHGLSYTTFAVGDLRLSSSTMKPDGSVLASVDVKNTGARAGDDVVQLYLHDPVASMTQPVRRLRGFQRVTLAPGRDEEGHVPDRHGRRRLLRQRRASSASSRGRSSSTRATARPPSSPHRSQVTP